jgi:uncharacterized iron-regulated membrane protein
MNIQVSKKLVARLTEGHKLLALSLSAVLFLICISGTVAVFFKEFERWEKPHVAEFTEYQASSVARTVSDAQAIMRADQRRKEDELDLFIGLPNPVMPRLIAGYNDDARAYDQEGRYIGSARHDNTHFLSELHYYLHLPDSFGMIIVSILGIFMLALLVGGALSHRKIFIDAFRLRPREKGHLGRTDVHNRIGTWTLPFTLVVTATGSFIGFSQVIVFLVATLFYQGNLNKTVEPVFGSEELAHTYTQGRPFLGERAIVNSLHELKKYKPDQAPILLTVKNAVSSAPYIEITTSQNKRLVYGETYRFNSEGKLVGSHQLSDGSIGKQIYASLFPLHFGSYGGLLVQIMYVFVGLSLCLMIHAGMEIWFTKSANRGHPRPIIHTAWISFIYSCVSAIAITMCFGFFISESLPTIYWGTLSLLVIFGSVVGQMFSQKIASTMLMMRTILGLSIFALVLTHLIYFQSVSVAAIWPNLILTCIAVLIFISNLSTLKKIKRASVPQVEHEISSVLQSPDDDINYQLSK